MVSVSNNVIKMTRGDTLRTKVNIFLPDESEYIPVDGDIITFGLKKKREEETILNIDIPFDSCELHISPLDTKSLDYGTYYYDIQIQLTNGDIYTFINWKKFLVVEEACD